MSYPRHPRIVCFDPSCRPFRIAGNEDVAPPAWRSAEALPPPRGGKCRPSLALVIGHWQHFHIFTFPLVCAPGRSAFLDRIYRINRIFRIPSNCQTTSPLHYLTTSLLRFFASSLLHHPPPRTCFRARWFRGRRRCRGRLRQGFREESGQMNMPSSLRR